MENLVLSEKNQRELYIVASELSNGQTVFSPDEMTEFIKKVASKLTFMVHVDTVRRYIECEYTTVIQEKSQFREMIDTFQEAWEEDRTDFIFSILFLIGIFFALWAGLWLIAIIEGRV